MPSLDFSCWPQLLPLQREATIASPTGQTPVLFQLPSPDDLPALVTEILRLGNDRQSFRYLGDGTDAPVLLRVVGPPYYSLLRALDRDGNTKAPRAYLERGPRLWVEIGHTHPLMQNLTAPEGKLVLLRPPRDWVYLDEAPFRDIYDILEFTLPSVETRWEDAELEQSLQVALRLTGGGSQEPAEMWVLRERAVEALDEFVRGADDQLLNRLSFAVGEQEDRRERCIVLRVRPSRLAPPVLVLPGKSFRPYLKLPNLFLPVGARLHPPLRRDAVRKLFAEDPDQITWLYPEDDGTFTPEHMPDSVFRPLTDWIDYVLDHDHVALRAWVQSTQFEFESFICKDDQDPRPEKPKKPEGRDKRHGRKDGGAEVGNETAYNAAAVTKARKKEAKDAALPELPRAAPKELEIQLHALEKRFLDVPGGLDAAERQALWPQLALLNAAVGNSSDATLCFVHALWEDSPETVQWAPTWLREESKGRGTGLSEKDLTRLLTNDKPSLSDVRVLSAAVVSAAQQETPSPELLQRLLTVQEFLQRHEMLLPVRAVWLVALALYRLSNGDLLALTRTRDRLLERLFKGGLSSEQDLPTFLRFSGARSSDRFRAFRDWLLPLPEKIRRWIQKNPARNLEQSQNNAAETEAYASLILAFGLARLGEEQRARQLRQSAREVLGGKDEVHTCLLEAFDYRLHQALEGKPPTGPLPPEQLEYLEQLSQETKGQDSKSNGRIIRYKVDRLRQNSRILEPHEKINPYRSWQVRYFDDLGKKLAALPDIIDRAELEKTCLELLHETRGKAAKDKTHRAQVVKAVLGVAPRISETFAQNLLPETLPACDALSEVIEQAELLEKGMFVAAHFDQSAHVQAMVGRFRSLLGTLHGQSAAKLDELAEQCFRGLRKLGMRDEIHELLRKMAEVVTDGKPLAKLRERKEWASHLRTLLHVAGSWYYFGMESEAKPVMEEARTLLYHGELDAREQTKLACAYAKTLGQAPVDIALQCIDEMFQKLERVADTFTTNSHYSVSQLSVVEAVVLSVVSEDFALGTMARRWLDDEEFLIRRRVHADVHGLMGQAHL